MTPQFDDFDVFAAHLMTIVALEGQTLKAQRKIAGILRDSASPSVAFPPPSAPDGVSAPSRFMKDLEGV